MPEVIQNLDRLLQKLGAEKTRAARENGTHVEVGYAQTYAIVVHEDLTASHAPGKQAKYLESPARRMNRELETIVVAVYKNTKSIKRALYSAGLALLKASQRIVPVDTGALRASGYVAVGTSTHLLEVHQSSFARSESRRVDVTKRRRDRARRRRGGPD